MSEDQQQPESDQQAPEEVIPDKVEPEKLNNSVNRADLPWQAVQLEEQLPEDVAMVGYYVLNRDYVIVTDKGFYGKHEGQVQCLRVFVVVDNK